MFKKSPGENRTREMPENDHRDDIWGQGFLESLVFGGFLGKQVMSQAFLENIAVCLMFLVD